MLQNQRTSDISQQFDTYCRLFVESIQTYGLLMLSPDGTIMAWNQGAEHLLGYSSDEVVGQPYSSLFPEEAVTIGLPGELLKKAESTGSFSRNEWKLHRDGSRVHLRCTLSPLRQESDGSLIGFSKTIHEIDREHQPEHSLQKVLKDLADLKFALDESTIVAITDKKGWITYANDAFCKISRYPREELIGQDHRLINSGYHPKSFFQDMWETISHGNVWKGEIRNRAKDGSIYWVDTTIVPFLDAHGTPYQYVAIRHDISARKRIETEIRLLNEQLEQRVLERTAELNTKNQDLAVALAQLQESEALRSTFISALTHDLRTPLVAQKRALEIFQSKASILPEKLALLADRMYQSNDDLLKMVNTLLETYQFESGKIRILLEPVNLRALTDSCFEEVAPIAESKKIALKNRVPKDLPEIVGDGSQLKRVWMNLLGNALENIPAGSYVQIDAVDTGDAIEVTVADNGPGIPKEHLPYLFKRYFMGEKTRKKIGSGLGLYICHMVMEIHGGTIRVESVLDTGTTFILVIPKEPPSSGSPTKEEAP